MFLRNSKTIAYWLFIQFAIVLYSSFQIPNFNSNITLNLFFHGEIIQEEICTDKDNQNHYFSFKNFEFNITFFYKTIYFFHFPSTNIINTNQHQNFYYYQGIPEKLFVSTFLARAPPIV